MLRLLGLIVVVLFTGFGALLLVSAEGASQFLGLVLVLTGCTWLVVDGLRRRGAI